MLTVGAQASRYQGFAPAAVLAQHVIKHLAPALGGFLRNHAGGQSFGRHVQQRAQELGHRPEAAVHIAQFGVKRVVEVENENGHGAALNEE
ncbi:hypothetical protein ACFQT0_14745 [Hymenobacter humi]|uniref:Uncharacterized protein n=1 Tax=Hymenobacter humi TaxID=1411620 RepID=A0ABW2U4Z7_9BACT